MKNQIDKLDRNILRLISQNARIPFLEVARECNVSGAAIHQRVQKLNALGVLKGSEFILDTYKIGYQTCAYIGLHFSDIAHSDEVIEQLKDIPEIVECHITTGNYTVFIKVYAKDNRHLLDIIMNKISKIEYIDNTETFTMSLEEVFNRQLAVFDNDSKIQDIEE
ncbi:MAG: Lrp/AsnC ligand binding domain-containing protein [bacterium]